MINDRRALTDRERQVVALVAQGLSNKEIARVLNIADSTTKVHLHNIFGKLAVRNRTALALMATETPSLAPVSAPALVPAD
jgi:DNA-binding NarL/FixJ family response regulator